MTSALEQPESFVTGLGWRAEVFPGRIHLAVNPEGDHLEAAIDGLLTKRLQKFCTVTPVGEDAYGWNMYILTNDTGLRIV